MWLDLIAFLVFAGVTWAVSSEGFWGALVMFCNALLAALIATNYFEPLARLLARQVPGGKYWWDLLVLMVLFSVTMVVLRVTTESLGPGFVRFPRPLFHAGRWLFGAATAWVMLCFLFMALHTAPLPRDFLDFSPERENFFGFAPDRAWLGFMQRTSEQIFERTPPDFDPDRYVFDPKALFLPSYAARRAEFAAYTPTEDAPQRTGPLGPRDFQPRRAQ